MDVLSATLEGAFSSNRPNLFWDLLKCPVGPTINMYEILNLSLGMWQIYAQHRHGFEVFEVFLN
jgi:hypothetical protein